MHSAEATKRVPICTPWAPRARAAARPRPSAMPPAATTGMRTASTTWGTRASVVISPMCPPDSMPSATRPSAPMRSRRLARATLATTGSTLMPAALSAGRKGPGVPAPVVTTGTFSSMTTWTICRRRGAR